jgi:hypothetical protein
LPSYDRTNRCFNLINREEESSKVSSVIPVSKPDYVEKMPFPPREYVEKIPFKSLPPKGESKKSMKKKKKKKKKKRSKRREDTVSSLKHYDPAIDYDNSDWDDVPMPITYVSDHDWEKHSTFDIENLFGTNSKVNNCCTISAIHVPSYDDMFEEYALRNSCPLVYDGYDDEYNIFSSPTIEEKNSYDYNMPPVFDDYVDENNYSVESAPTSIVPVVSINSFMHVAHDREALCDSYIVSSIHDVTESYYERGKHGLMNLNNIEFPLFMLQFLKLYLFCLPMLFCFALS